MSGEEKIGREMLKRFMKRLKGITIEIMAKLKMEGSNVGKFMWV